ncbi:MAG: methyltransferase domain-containing protein [Alphaproteobacteria bacterium]|nr:methyltransferase domain-containing protein [Alphaproteobacteria bacterium]
MTIADFDQFAVETPAESAPDAPGAIDREETLVGRCLADIRSARAREGLDVEGPLSFLGLVAGGVASAPRLTDIFPGAQRLQIDADWGRNEGSNNGEARSPASGAPDVAPLSLDEGSVDVAFAAFLFDMLVDREHGSRLREIRRVIRPGGELYLFERNPAALFPGLVDDSEAGVAPDSARRSPIAGKELSRRLAMTGFTVKGLAYGRLFPSSLTFLRPLERALGGAPLGAVYCVRGAKFAVGRR